MEKNIKKECKNFLNKNKKDEVGPNPLWVVYLTEGKEECLVTEVEIIIMRLQAPGTPGATRR